jgi:hypothetical protein
MRQNSSICLLGLIHSPSNLKIDSVSAGFRNGYFQDIDLKRNRFSKLALYVVPTDAGNTNISEFGGRAMEGDQGLRTRVCIPIETWMFVYY